MSIAIFNLYFGIKKTHYEGGHRWVTRTIHNLPYFNSIVCPVQTGKGITLKVWNTTLCFGDPLYCTEHWITIKKSVSKYAMLGPQSRTFLLFFVNFTNMSRKRILRVEKLPCWMLYVINVVHKYTSTNSHTQFPRWSAPYCILSY